MGLKLEDIFSNYSLKTKTIEVEAWGGSVSIKELSAEAMEEMRKTEGSELEMAVVAIIHSVTDEEGKNLFSKSDKVKLLKMAAGVLVEVSTAIISLSDLVGDDEGKA